MPAVVSVQGGGVVVAMVVERMVVVVRTIEVVDVGAVAVTAVVDSGRPRHEQALEMREAGYSELET